MGGAGLVCAALAVDEAEAVCSMGDWAGLPPATCIGEREGLESDSGDSGSWSSISRASQRLSSDRARVTGDCSSSSRSNLGGMTGPSSGSRYPSNSSSLSDSSGSSCISSSRNSGSDGKPSPRREAMTTRVALRAYRRKIKESEVPQRFAWCNNATLPAQGGRARCNNATLPVKEINSMEAAVSYSCVVNKCTVTV